MTTRIVFSVTRSGGVFYLMSGEEYLDVVTFAEFVEAYGMEKAQAAMTGGVVV